MRRSSYYQCWCVDLVRSLARHQKRQFLDIMQKLDTVGNSNINAEAKIVINMILLSHCIHLETPCMKIVCCLPKKIVFLHHPHVFHHVAMFELHMTTRRAGFLKFSFSCPQQVSDFGEGWILCVVISELSVVFALFAFHEIKFSQLMSFYNK